MKPDPVRLLLLYFGGLLVGICILSLGGIAFITDLETRAHFLGTIWRGVSLWYLLNLAFSAVPLSMWIYLRIDSTWNQWRRKNNPETLGPPTREDVLRNIEITVAIIASENLTADAQQFLCETLVSNKATPAQFQSGLKSEEIYTALFG